MAAIQSVDENRGPVLLAVSWCLTLIATVFLVLRLYCKLSTRRQLWWDDWILMAGWGMIVVNDVLTTFLVDKLGLGRHISVLVKDDPVELSLALSSRATVTLTALAWTKTAFAVTLLRLTNGSLKAFIWFIIISMNIALGFSAVVPWIQCTPLEKGWNGKLEGTCWGPTVGVNIWIATGAFSGAADFTLAAIPWTFLPSLHLVRKEKIGIAIAMSMGIIAGTVAIVKCINLPVLEAGDGFTSVGLYVWDITESIATVVAACIPSLRILVRRDERLYETPKLRHITVESTTTPSSFGNAPGSHDMKIQSRRVTEEVVELGGKGTGSRHFSVR